MTAADAQALSGARTAPVLEVRGLDIALPAGSGRASALKGVSLRVERAQTLCVIGAPGAGKSVLARAVAGLLPHTLPISAGHIVLQGEDITQAGAQRQRGLRAARVGIVWREPALDPRMSCGEQIDEVLRSHTRLTRSERQAKVQATLAELGLAAPERIAASWPHQISAGERQRVAMAMAFVLDPALLVADEATSALDALGQAQLLALLREMQERRGTAMLVMTHDAGVAARIAHPIRRCHAGEAVEIGAADQVLHAPRHEITRTLTAETPTLQWRERALDAHAPVVLRVRALAKSYEDRRWFGARAPVQAVRDVSFELRRGQTLGLVGASGAGKSTVARCVVRLETPGSGSIALGRDEIANIGAAYLRPLRRRVQIVLPAQGRSLDPRRTIGDMMIEGPLNFGMPREHAEERAREMLAMVQVAPGALARHPHELEPAALQRICLARALMVEPELLVVDDSPAASALPLSVPLLELYEDIQRRLYFAMLFVTHDLRAASRVCDQLAVMQAGRIVEHGVASAVLGDPQHAHTRALLAAVAEPELAGAG